MVHTPGMGKAKKSGPRGVPVQAWFDEEEKRTPGFIARVDSNVARIQLAHKLDQERRKLRLTRPALARRAGLRREQVEKMVKKGGAHVPSLEVLERVARVLGKKIDLKVRGVGRT